MARAASVNGEIEALVRNFSQQLESLIRKAIAEQVGHHVAQLRSSLPRPDGRKGRLCPVPGCGALAAGPKYRWRCRDHKSVELLRPAGGGAAVAVKQLPPSPGPRTRRGGPPRECRLPGCSMRNKGPRYNFFCGDHYKALTREEQHHYAELWKQQRSAPAVIASGADVRVRKRLVEQKSQPVAQLNGAGPTETANEA